MGQANKIIFQLTSGVMADIPESCHVRIDTKNDEKPFHFLLRQFGHDTAIAYIAGDLSMQLEQAGSAAMIDYALQHLKAILGNASADAVIKADSNTLE